MTTAARVQAALRSNRRPLRAFAGAAIVAFFVLAAFAPGCKKDKESLILVEMQAIDDNAGALTDVAITVSESTGEQVAEPIFILTAGIPMTPDSLTYGVYIPAGVSGTLTVNVRARPAVGCDGYVGTKSVKVLGGDSPPVTVILKAGNTCGGTTTGTAGTSGNAGSTGFGGSSGGAGGSGGGSSGPVCGVTSVGTPVPPVTTAPALTTCTYVDQLGSGVTCDTGRRHQQSDRLQGRRQPGRSVHGDLGLGLLQRRRVDEDLALPERRRPSCAGPNTPPRPSARRTPRSRRTASTWRSRCARAMSTSSASPI